MNKLVEMTQRIPSDKQGFTVEDHLAATMAIPGCVLAYARKSTAGDGEPDTVVSLHVNEDDSMMNGHTQRRVLMDHKAVNAMVHGPKIVELCQRLLKEVGDRKQRENFLQRFKTAMAQTLVELGDLLDPPN